jgi:NADPH:quinone reductase-like Zn-dependent oxidoreductase
MRAVRIHQFGDPDVLTLDDISKPNPDSTEVLVRVRAASVNPIDCKTRQGSAISVELPWTVGWDVTGVVESVGVNVTDFSEGDEVYGLIEFPDGGGTYAEYTAAPANELIQKPAELSFEEAAATPLVSLTAWEALDATEVKNDTRVLIHAAAGGVGHFAVQFAKEWGAHVIGTASGANKDYLRDLGADEIVNYREQRFEETIDPVDAVVDTIGGETFTQSLEVLNDGGIIDKLPGELSDQQLENAEEHNVQAVHTSVRPNQEWFAEITGLVSDGTVSPTIDTVVPLSDAQRAHKLSEEGHTRGKLVLTMDE